MFLCNGTLIINITAIGHVWHLLKPLPSLQWRKGFYPEYLGSISLLLWNSKDKYHPFSFVALNPNGVGFHLGEQDSSRHLLVLSSTPWKHIHICIGNIYTYASTSIWTYIPTKDTAITHFRWHWLRILNLQTNTTTSVLHLVHIFPWFWTSRGIECSIIFSPSFPE